MLDPLAPRLELGLARLHRGLLEARSLWQACWAITQEAISLLDLQDCVVYLLEPDGETLCQMAAWGPKMAAPGLLESQIRLRLGEGIVGDCALRQQTQWVPDVRLDPRYITDDAHRGSELAVPILHEERLIGVLDSEHPDPHYYTRDHAHAFHQIAALAADHLVRLRVQTELRPGL